jgi:hypothetical protein
VQGGWTQPWQDELGQWHAPWAAQLQPTEQPPYPGAAAALAEPQPAVDAPVIVEPQELAPVGPPRHYAPRRAVHDPRQRTMAAVITFIALLIGLWGILGFMGSLSKTLAAINGGNAKLKLQMTEANVGLAQLDEKTRPLQAMADNSRVMGEMLGGIDTEMGSMLDGVERIATSMQQLDGALQTLDTELGRVNEINAGMTTQLGAINTGLESQLGKVRTMRRDVQSTGVVLGTLPGRLAATNARLAHVNGAVNTMGCRGITNNLKVDIRLGPIPNGSAQVFATVIPPSAWGTRQDGVTPC